jgi:hypothetical protein
LGPVSNFPAPYPPLRGMQDLHQGGSFGANCQLSCSRFALGSDARFAPRGFIWGQLPIFLLQIRPWVRCKISRKGFIWGQLPTFLLQIRPWVRCKICTKGVHLGPIANFPILTCELCVLSHAYKHFDQVYL